MRRGCSCTDDDKARTRATPVAVDGGLEHGLEDEAGMWPAADEKPEAAWGTAARP